MGRVSRVSKSQRRNKAVQTIRYTFRVGIRRDIQGGILRRHFAPRIGCLTFDVRGGNFIYAIIH